jgi:hypothetical protein
MGRTAGGVKWYSSLWTRRNAVASSLPASVWNRAWMRRVRGSASDRVRKGKGTVSSVEGSGTTRETLRIPEEASR